MLKVRRSKPGSIGLDVKGTPLQSHAIMALRIENTIISNSNNLETLMAMSMKSTFSTQYWRGFGNITSLIGSVNGMIAYGLDMKQATKATRQRKTKFSLAFGNFLANASMLATTSFGIANAATGGGSAASAAAAVVPAAAVAAPITAASLAGPIAAVVATSAWLAASVYRLIQVEKKLKPDLLFHDRIYRIEKLQSKIDDMLLQYSTLAGLNNSIEGNQNLINTLLDALAPDAPNRDKTLKMIEKLKEALADEIALKNKVDELVVKQDRLKRQAVALYRESPDLIVKEADPKYTTFCKKYLTQPEKLFGHSIAIAGEQAPNAEEKQRDKYICESMRAIHLKERKLQITNVVSASILLAGSVLFIVACCGASLALAFGIVAAAMCLVGGLVKATHTVPTLLANHRNVKKAVAHGDAFLKEKFKDFLGYRTNEAKLFPSWVIREGRQLAYLCMADSVANAEGKKMDAVFLEQLLKDNMLQKGQAKEDDVIDLQTPNKTAIKCLDDEHRKAVEEVALIAYAHRAPNELFSEQPMDYIPPTAEKKSVMSFFSPKHKGHILSDAGELLHKEVLNKPEPGKA